MTSPTFSIVTCCKGRLEFLKRSLPTFVQQAETEVVVVDYDCPERTKDWVAAHYPDVRVAAVADAPLFNLSRARNIGVDAARGRWLVLCDADMLLVPSFAQEMRERMAPGTYLRPYQDTPSGARKLPFPLLCEATAYRDVGGYDDAFRGWGAEDWEFVGRLDRHGLTETLYPAALVETLKHSNATRSSYYEHEIGVSMVINHHYAKIKERYRETRGCWFTDAQRRSAYESVHRAVIASIADPRSDVVHDIPIDGADPPWTARLPAAAIRNYHRMTVEALARTTL
jgi:glycosyltransferase involved in cell wall biosynthesis